MPKPMALWVLVLMLLAGFAHDGAAQSSSSETRFTFCNRHPITLQIYVIQSVSEGVGNGSILENLADFGVRFEGRGWRQLRPEACFTVRSNVRMTVALSINYDFGSTLEPIRAATGDQDENPSGIGYVPVDTVYCVGRFEDPEAPVVQRDTLDDFRPRNGTSCPSTRLEMHPFSIQTFVSRGSTYTLEY